MKEWLKKMLQQKEQQRSKLKDKKVQLRDKGKKSDSAEEIRSLGDQIDGIESQMEQLDLEIADFRSQLESLPEESETTPPNPEEGETRSTPSGQLNVLGTYGVGGGASAVDAEGRSEEEVKKLYETRGAALKEKRSVTFELDEIPELRAVSIGGGTLIVEKKYSQELNNKFNEVSSLVDVVNGVPLVGGESYTKGFEISSGEGDYTTENGEYADAEPEFGYVTINKAKITAYAEMTDESMKLPNVDYQSRVAKNI